LARIFFGPCVAFSVVDFFLEIYWGDRPALRPLVRLFRALDLAAWRRLPVLFTRAQATKTYLVAKGVAPERVFPVYDPCDFDVYHPEDRAAARRRFGYGSEEIVLVHHGILHPNKGNDRILRGLATLRAAYPQLRYLLVGDGPEMGRLKALSAELGLMNHVQFTGWLAGMGEVNTALNAGDIGLVMRVGSQHDDFHATGALVHSMACGLPILSARLGGTSEIVREGSEGLLFDPQDMTAFADKLKQLVEDPSLRAACGQRALLRARELFAMQRVTRDTVEPLLALLR
jgi:glycosyltransferase involved in cell wall biosynthesis